MNETKADIDDLRAEIQKTQSLAEAFYWLFEEVRSERAEIFNHVQSFISLLKVQLGVMEDMTN